MASSRRSFLKTLATAGTAAAAAPLVVPRHVLGGPGYQAPSDTVNVAGIGVGGMGKYNLEQLKSQNIVALADADHDYASEVFETFSDAATFYDYRRMFDEMGDQIDAVVIATPDHTHAKIAIDAMRRGTHVYVQKPLTWSVAEAQAVEQVARETGVVTQMGNQGHSGDAGRRINEYIRSGRIGDVEQVHVWTDRPVGWWPQGVDMPKTVQRPPDKLKWDLFLGPAPNEPYHEAFHPFRWRGWVQYGTGAVGDMAAHLLDHPWWALELGYPTTVETTAANFNGVSWPDAARVYYDFPATEHRPAVELTWSTGGLKPERPEGWPEDETMGTSSGGVLYEGTEGTLVHGKWGNQPRFVPESLGKEDPPQMFDRIENGADGHEMNWIRAIRGETEPVSDFEYAAPLTEVMLLGLVSLRAGQRKIQYDPESVSITNLPDADQYLRRQNPRAPWALGDEIASRQPASKQ
ncbi:MAG TPA: Gfo/Idh/MocA family oxidoreductase [Salinibacter sp.]|nr:Gfo/Idh/MocA family oxidoreductase [Salinibacter sp.]